MVIIYFERGQLISPYRIITLKFPKFNFILQQKLNLKLFQIRDLISVSKGNALAQNKRNSLQ